MDIISLAGRLPSITEGVQTWITKSEKSTAGHRLALGDTKANPYACNRKTKCGLQKEGSLPQKLILHGWKER